MDKSTREQTFKTVMGNYPTGVTVVTTVDHNGTPVGLTVNSFASVSLDPTLILWSIDHRVSTIDIFKKTDKFAVHTLASDQGDLCALFASKEKDDLLIVTGNYQHKDCLSYQVHMECFSVGNIIK